MLAHVATGHVIASLAVGLVLAVAVRVISGRVLDRIRSREAATRPPEARNRPDGTPGTKD